MAWGELGLAALFFTAGMEPDLERVRGRPLTLAIRGWALSLVLGLLVAALLYVLPIVHSPMMVALALSTTALGTLLPILREAGQLETGFGRLVLAADAVGEFGCGRYQRDRSSNGAHALGDRGGSVGAGMLSVLLFPTFAGVLLSRIVRTAPSVLS
jgi:hypothetical protein